MIRLLLSLCVLFAACALSSAREFVHPGGLHTREDLDRMKRKVAAKESPWIDGWEALLQDRKARSDYLPSPHPQMISRQRAQDDATAAYLNAIRWYISGDKAHAVCAVRILNGWAAAIEAVPAGPDHPGLIGIPIGSFALAAEVLRVYPGWAEADRLAFKVMLETHLYPLCHDFLTRHRGAAHDKWWANWDACNMAALMAIGVFCDNAAIFDEAVAYYKGGAGMGSIRHAVPFRYPDGLGQWQESGRDQAHTMGGQGLLSQMCQVAWNQGVDLFGHDGNRLLAGAEYTAQFTLWKGVPYTFYTNSDRANQYYISSNYRGRLLASHFELLHNHYVVRRGLEAPHVRMLAELLRPESGEVDVFGYGTLTFTLDAAESPHPAVEPPPVPLDLRAIAGVGRVDLRWSPSGAYTTHGHEILRAISADGPFKSLRLVDHWTTPAFTDDTVEPGGTYHYRVVAFNKTGRSAPSAVVSATAAEAGELPRGWTAGRTGAGFAEAAGQTFIITAAPRDESFTHREVAGDFTLTAKLADFRGKVDLTGIGMRGSLDDGSPFASMTVGDYGGRIANFRARTAGGKSDTHQGNAYTWPPVWLRLQREGETVRGYQSADGIAWFQVGEARVVIGEKMLVGFFARGDSGQATFTDVTGEPEVPAAPASPGKLEARADGRQVVLSWPRVEGIAGYKVEASLGGGGFHEIADLPADATGFTNTGVKDPSRLRYRVRSYHRGGISAPSPVAP